MTIVTEAEDAKEKLIDRSIKDLFPGSPGEERLFISEVLQTALYANNFLLMPDTLDEKKRNKVKALGSLIQHFVKCRVDWPCFIMHPSDCNRLISPLCLPDRETFFAIYLDSHQKVLGTSLIAVGNADFAYVNLRSLLSYALRYNCSRFIISHNHPSGDCHPSEEDCAFTRKVAESCRQFSITLLDHVIIGSQYYSFKENRLLD